jgi:hypothetical protein
LRQETITVMPLLKTLVLAYTAAGVNAFTTIPSQEGGAALPERMTYGGTSAKPLDNIGGTAYDLAECQGDCDNDDDCQTGLECFQRGGYEAVPGCSGQGKKGWDYCIAAKLYSGGGTCPSGMTPFSGGCIDVAEQEPSECSVNGKDIFEPTKKACEERGLALCSMQEYLDAYMDGAATRGSQSYGISSTTCSRAHDYTSAGHFLIKYQGRRASVSGCHGNANCWSNRYYRCCSGGASKVTCGAGTKAVNGECVPEVSCGAGTGEKNVAGSGCQLEVECQLETECAHLGRWHEPLLVGCWHSFSGFP